MIVLSLLGEVLWSLDSGLLFIEAGINRLGVYPENLLDFLKIEERMHKFFYKQRDSK